MTDWLTDWNDSRVSLHWDSGWLGIQHGHTRHRHSHLVYLYTYTHTHTGVLYWLVYKMPVVRPASSSWKEMEPKPNRKRNLAKKKFLLLILTNGTESHDTCLLVKTLNLLRNEWILASGEKINQWKKKVLEKSIHTWLLYYFFGLNDCYDNWFIALIQLIISNVN